MTTSQIDSIAAHLVTHLQTITGLSAALGPVSDVQSHPFAMVRIDPGEQAAFMYPQSYSDRAYVVGILIEGTKADVSSCIESIWKLWPR